MNGVITNGDISIAEIGLAYLPILCDSNNMEYEADPTWYIIYDLRIHLKVGNKKNEFI